MATYTSTIIVTGGTTGLGYECAKTIAKQQPKTLVLICARSGEASATTLNQALGQQNVEYRRLDLGELDDVRRFSADVIQEVRKRSGGNDRSIKALVLNAGLQVQAPSPRYTSTGVETTFGVNHVGHALLAYLLLPHVAPDGRVVLTSSGTHDPAQNSGMPLPVYTSADDVAHPALKGFNGGERYSTSKLCNVLWTYALGRRLEQRRQELQQQQRDSSWSVTVTAMDPGLMPGTGLAREYGAAMRFIWSNVLPHMLPVLRVLMRTPNVHTTAESGAALARLAIDIDVAGVSAKYFEGREEIASSKDSYDESKQEDLWEWTARLVGKDAAEVEAFRTLKGLGF